MQLSTSQRVATIPTSPKLTTTTRRTPPRNYHQQRIRESTEARTPKVETSYLKYLPTLATSAPFEMGTNAPPNLKRTLLKHEGTSKIKFYRSMDVPLTSLHRSPIVEETKKATGRGYVER
jgi:hypothetical protein